MSSPEQKRYVRFKSALTRAQNSGDAQKVIDEVTKFETYYKTSKEPIPDHWHRWQNARDDAYLKLRKQPPPRALFD